MGPALNCAERMEASGEPGQVHVSADVWDALMQDDYEAEECTPSPLGHPEQQLPTWLIYSRKTSGVHSLCCDTHASLTESDATLVVN